jgi:hypothetical protein
MIFFIGPVRCGTTWLHEMFKKHTSCSYIPGKEIYFLEKANADGLIEDYLSKFHHRSNVYVDISPTYFASESIAKKIKAAFPDSIIVIIKRNPVAIAISQYRYIKRNGISNCTFDEFISKSAFANIRKRFMYSVYLPIWKQIFRNDQIIYLDYEDFKIDPVSYFCTACKKIGIDTILEVDVNQGYEPQNKLWKLCHSKLRGIIPSAVRDCSTYQFRSTAHTELEFHNKTINDSVGKPRLRYLYRTIVWLGRILQLVISRQRLLQWRVGFFDRIFINRSANELITEKSLMAAKTIFQNDINYMEHI